MLFFRLRSLIRPLNNIVREYRKHTRFEQAQPLRPDCDGCRLPNCTLSPAFWASVLLTLGFAATATVSADTRSIQREEASYRLASIEVPPKRHTASLGRNTGAPLREQSLWSRLRSGFRLEHQHDHPLVAQEIRYLVRNARSWQHRAQRIRLHLPYIVEQTEQLGLPSELALVPMIESGLDPYAFSHGGAAGLWQFIPTTAQRFGLQSNWWYDGRRDIVAATDAALAYFSFLHQSFDDWYLALAGYNAGEGSVRRALRKAKVKTANSKTYWTLPLPAETKRYVPRLLAYAAIIAQPERYGIALPATSVRVKFNQVELPAQFDLMKVADVLEVPIDDLYQLNPSLNQWATPPDGPHRLLVPKTMTDAGMRLAAVPARERVNWVRHSIAKGESLSVIAKRYQTDTATLRKVNDLPNDRIRAGKTLLVPKSAQAVDDYPIARLSSGRVHIVKAGDSLWSIAKTYKVRVPQLVRWNELAPKAALRVGKRLRIAPSERQVTRRVRYAVRRGDSLSHIASRFNVSLADLVQWNSLDAQRLLKPGQPLTLYVNVTSGR